jgi:poly(glycerol-phosphate) alpha-glucosyltransferase
MATEETFPDGEPWRVTYCRGGEGPDVFDYLRADGTPYLRIPDFDFEEPSTWPTAITRSAAGAR